MPYYQKPPDDRFVRIARGSIALLAGAVLLYLSHEVVMNLIFFICGVFFIYYAIAELQLIWIVTWAEKAFRRLKKKVSS